MNALSQQNHCVSEQEYLAHYTQIPDVKYEYINGEIWAMAGASRNHNVLTMNFAAALYPHLKGARCKPFASDWRVKCGQHYYYPDVVVDCDSLRDNNQAGQPIVIIEVLSESTRAADLTFKLNDYKKIPSLQEYVLVEQDFMAVTVFRRENYWQATVYSQNDDFIELNSIGFVITVAELYADVVFPEKKHFQAA